MTKLDEASQIVIRPKEVELAIKLMITATALGILVGYLNIPVSSDHEHFQAYTYLILLEMLMNIYFIYKVSQNRDWARKIYIGVTIVSFLYYLPRLFAVIVSTPFNGVLQFISMLIQVIAVYFLLRKGTKQWFLLVKRAA
ncbi:hypothetical protein Desdi_1810 [Desulfitobacterium dichloroeliminans LMG P-21439]|uniref:Uncharacterized protein n=1 Tax=Desulfitobacterium dichloroeliminans (strain LMG P-21439 / DCA1) TaxID=871963 RepID=L0F895_DESDL|nr:hypothetical protein [Desulfitobacterium dichloroeliminans]AGA69260.1 hypothetical protein Desdi_1810 [Desulfitobacterium dichloroeliminans LMG P-21439]